MSGRKSSWLEQRAPTQACFQSKTTISSAHVRRSISWPGRTSHLILILLQPCTENHIRKRMDDNLHACMHTFLCKYPHKISQTTVWSLSRTLICHHYHWGKSKRNLYLSWLDPSFYCAKTWLHWYGPFPLPPTHSHTPVESVVVSGLTPLLLYWQADYELRLSPSRLSELFCRLQQSFIGSTSASSSLAAKSFNV